LADQRWQRNLFFWVDNQELGWPDGGMEEFDVRGHARLVGNVLIGLAIFAFGIALADLIPDEIFALPPHYFGNGGAVAIGLLFLVSGVWLRKS
jgi:hypothetical protein